MAKKVTIELTADQQKAIHNETGAEVKSLTLEALEDRDAPKTGGVSLSAGDVPMRRVFRVVPDGSSTLE
jgi:hypothetical protein